VNGDFLPLVLIRCIRSAMFFEPFSQRDLAYLKKSDRNADVVLWQCHISEVAA
jgi:hypothetical protein